jgi:hypothetical protein
MIGKRSEVSMWFWRSLKAFDRASQTAATASPTHQHGFVVSKSKSQALRRARECASYDSDDGLVLILGANRPTMARSRRQAKKSGVRMLFHRIIGRIRNIWRRLFIPLGHDDLFGRVLCFLWGVLLLCTGLIMLVFPAIGGMEDYHWLVSVAAWLLGCFGTAAGVLKLLRSVLPATAPIARFTDEWLPLMVTKEQIELPVLLIAIALTKLLRLFGVRGWRATSRRSAP